MGRPPVSLDIRGGAGALAKIDLSLTEKVNLQERVYTILRNALIRGQFEPGAQLTIRTLAKLLGTSTVPVRDALQRLVAERSLELRGNRSACVPVMTRDSFEELVRIRILLEGEAIDRIRLPISPENLDELELLQRKFELAVERGDALAVTDANTEFHFTLYRLAKGELLYGMIETLWVRTGPALRTPFSEQTYDPEVFRKGAYRHAEILKNLRAGKLGETRTALHGDILDTAGWYNSHFFSEQSEEIMP
ncbi:GntR family transcriptional regulator [Salipiger thiooxidans]|uniref:GntR family transcriptional regulator n=1 Tax=Salipiger thiooxidans TaxID=282683 RepID=UPI001CD24DE6|nr:GntR family transcriptional regulator [Salipiger thiooxidans]MCA0851319.1 GntR family transcriptional regulator [Salipiger thiooxidans]